MTKAESERLPGTIITRYRFDNVLYVKGSGPADSLVLVEEGGAVGNTEMVVSSGVSFRPGARYVVFAIRGTWALPDEYGAMHCGTGHPFEIRPDSISTEAVVHDRHKHAIVAFDDQHLVILGTHPWRPGMAYADHDRAYAFARPQLPPPRRSVPALLWAADSVHALRVHHFPADYSLAVGMRQQLRTLYLWPHQDPGNRVTEDELLRTLARFVARTSESGGEGPRPR